MLSLSLKIYCCVFCHFLSVLVFVCLLNVFFKIVFILVLIILVNLVLVNENEKSVLGNSLK